MSKGGTETIFAFEDDSTSLSWRSMIFRILVLQSTIDPKDIIWFNKSKEEAHLWCSDSGNPVEE